MLGVNKQKGEAVIGCDGKRAYRFRFDFDFINDLEQRTGLGAFAVYDHFTNGTQTVEMLRDVIATALYQVEGSPVKDTERVKAAQEFIETEGLEESFAAAVQFLSVAMIGDRKKQFAKRIATLAKISEVLQLSPLPSSKKPLFVLAVRSATLVLLICTAFKAFGVLG